MKVVEVIELHRSAVAKVKAEIAVLESTLKEMRAILVQAQVTCEHNFKRQVFYQPYEEIEECRSCGAIGKTYGYDPNEKC